MELFVLSLVYEGDMKNILITTFIICAVASASVYRDSGLGLYPFLKMDVGARAAALGGTGAVNGGDLAIFSNPALLASSNTSVSAGHNQWYGDTNQSYFAATSKIGRKLVGSLAFHSVSTTGIEYRDNPSVNPLDTFNAYDFSVNTAMAVPIGRFDIGVGFKYIHEKIWLESSNGWAVDVGFNYRALSTLMFSAAYLHSGPSVTMTDTEYRMPRTWVFASKWSDNYSFGDIAVSAQVKRPLDNRTIAGFGLEYAPFQWIVLRGGWKLNDDSSNLTTGAGFTAKGWALDYAFIPGEYSLGNSQRLSISRSF